MTLIVALAHAFRFKHSNFSPVGLYIGTFFIDMAIIEATGAVFP